MIHLFDIMLRIGLQAFLCESILVCVRNVGSRMLSINCIGFESFLLLLNNVFSTCDGLCVQELMLLKEECHLLNNVYDDFNVCGVSPFDSSMGVLYELLHGTVSAF